MFSSSFVTLAAILAFPLPQAAAKPTSCSIPQPCAVFSNASTGAGLQSSSSGGIGVFGFSASGSFLEAGIDGESSNQSGNDAGGTFGIGNQTGANPAYGVLGYGSSTGVYGETEASASAGGAGVQGYDASGGAVGSGDFNQGVLGQSGQGTGVLGLAGTSPRYLPVFPAGVAGVADTSAQQYSAVGVYAGSNSLPLEAHNDLSGSYVLLGGAQDLVAAQSGTNTVFSVSAAGSEYLKGTLTTSKGTYARQSGSSGVTRLTYGSQMTAPDIEDVGEARMKNGRADVAFDAALADTIDSPRGFIVFVTPEGDCKGLYVTQKTTSGFTVRELQGGRSSLSFAYRIVAKPLRSIEARLAVAPAVADSNVASRRPLSVRSVAGVPAFATPRTRLEAHLGAQGFFRAVGERQARLR